jgi:hypothetical protein
MNGLQPLTSQNGARMERLDLETFRVDHFPHNRREWFQSTNNHFHPNFFVPGLLFGTQWTENSV